MNKGLLIVGSADVKRALSMSDCIDAVDRAMRALSSGGADVPLRTVMKLPGGRSFFGVMPGYLSEPQGLGTKIITIFPDNAKLGLSSHVGLVLLFESEHEDVACLLVVLLAAQLGSRPVLLESPDGAERHYRDGHWQTAAEDKSGIHHADREHGPALRRLRLIITSPRGA